MSLPTPEPLNKKKSKNCIPANELLSWIEENVDTDGANIIKIRDHYLWSRGDVERHRVDVSQSRSRPASGSLAPGSLTTAPNISNRKRLND